MKNIYSTTRLFLFLLCLLCVTGCKKDEKNIARGTTGNLTWTLSEKGTLTISGTGEMPDYQQIMRSGVIWQGETDSPWSEYRNEITNVIIGNGVTSIGGMAFAYCIGLTSVTIPNSVISIGYYAFQGSSLTSVTIPNSVTDIRDHAFGKCNSLTSVTIGNSVTSIGARAFEKCSGLTSINVDNGNTAYSSEDGVLFNKTKTTLISFPIGKTGVYTIPNSVKSIGTRAFEECSITSVTIPNSVTDIGFNGSFVFTSCFRLKSIDVDNSNAEYSSEDGVLFNKTKTTLIQYPAGKTGTSYTIPNSVTYIGYEAFIKCIDLTSINIPNLVISIGKYAFQECIGLSSVIIGNSVTSIEEGTFLACKGLTSVTIGNSVTYISDFAFSYCMGLTDIIFESITPPWIYYNAFFLVDKSACTLHVPAASFDDYQALYGQNFGNIVAIE